MKKFTKISLIVAASCVAVGLAFVIAGLAVGVNIQEARSMVGIHPKEKQEYQVTDLADEQMDYKESFEGIKDLDLHLGMMDVQIGKSPDQQIYVAGRNLPKKFSCKKKGTTLKVETGEHPANILEKHDTYLMILLPTDYQFRTVDVEIGLGDLEAEAIQCEKLEIDCGLGNVTLKGKLQGDCDIDCGMGNVELDLENQEKEFNYSMECGMGNIQLGAKDYSGFSNKQKIKNAQNAYQMDLECGMGNVTVHFTDETID